MSSSYKNNYKKFLRQTYLAFAGVVIAVPFIIDASGGARPHASPTFNKTLADTVPARKDTVPPKVPKVTSKPGADTNVVSKDQDTSKEVTVDTVFIPKVSKDTLDAPVTYKAKDSIILMVPDKQFYLYGSANTKYKTIDLSAEKMNFDQNTGVLQATNAKDTAGKIIGRPVMNDGGQSFESDTLKYNFTSQKAKIYNTRSQYGEGYVHSELTKKASDNTIFGFKNGYTTCNLDTPHFSFRARKIKVIPDKLIISGPANLEIMGIPTPLYIPFAIFPITQGQRSGILPPQYVMNQQKGMGLENGGYYIGLGEHMDLTLRGDVYSYGSWSLTASPTYRKRYKYNGGLNLSFANTRFGDPAVPSEFTKSRDFRITWNHSMDSKARPGVNFGASVNFGSSSYNRFNVFDYSTRVNNNIGSSVTFSKTWQGKPYNLTLGLNHSQNLATRDVSISFPDGTFTVNTIYPFQPKEMVGTPKWYEKIGISYNGILRNQASFKDSLFGKQAMFNAMQSGMQHSIPVSFSIPVLKTLTFSPSVNYNEYWYTKKVFKKWNNNKRITDTSFGGVDTTYIPGFFTARDVTMSAALSTAVYGMYAFSKHSNIKAIRHVMRPTVSANYSPDFSSAYYYGYRYGKGDRDSMRISYFDGSIVGVPKAGTFGGLNFGLDNNLEMKVFSRKDTSGNHEKKVKLLDGFGITGSYNFVADSFKLSPFALYARTNLFDKVNISANATLNPYADDGRGHPVDKYVWQQGKFSLGRITTASVSLSTSFQSKDKKGQDKQKKIDSLENITNADAAMAAQQRQLQMMRNNPGEYVDFDIPWRVDLSYSLSYTNQLIPDSGGVVKRVTQYVSFNGDFSLTPKWKVGLNSGFDFTNMQIAYTNMYISRDLHCWQMSINLIPFGTFRQFSITINPKAGILRDLRINRSRQFYDF
ncbi:putative LPS assembly protein LptD [Chitinophaga qingshengii]|uniref:LPS-assembly protein LptD n=1 Tax=Chitinophaga qingshengii TaxID=1569794 RepID=A0ABR7TN01_9BACT|nr:putative LPS assembly protein LptD [Chitinophaga qingshengii]MBC9931861.1 LPS-assembly protein LptD [Chitinophaga qingshengii]